MLFLITFIICVFLFIILTKAADVVGAMFAAWISIFIFIGVGWVANVIALIGMIKVDAPLGAMLIARGVGVFIPPFGAVMGFFV